MKHFTIFHKKESERQSAGGKIIRTFSVLLLTLIGAITVQAQTEFNINSGDITIPATPAQNYIITGNGTATANTITIKSGYVGNITLKNVKITRTAANATSRSCITVEGRTITGTTVTQESKNSNLNPITKVNFILDGTTELNLAPTNVYPPNSSSVYCALQVDRGAQIHIRAIDENDDSSGVLIAKSTSKLPGDKVDYRAGNGGAGIGSRNYANNSTNTGQGRVEIYQSNGTKHSDRYASGGNIIISSGTITAWGGHGAGIGGGWYTYYDGMIIIYGGKVETRSARHSAGIGSGCPDGGGVIQTRHADNSMIIVLPPASIEAYGAQDNFQVNPNLSSELARLALSGAQVIAYMNDPNKPLITVRTEDYEKNANIYLDLSSTLVKGTTTLQDIFTQRELTYDLKKVRVGRTDTSVGTMSFNGQFDQVTTFFTDASSSAAATLGRPYMPVAKTVTAAEEIVLPLLATDIAFTDYPSTPLEEGYSTTQARKNAHVIKMEFKDPETMDDVTFNFQKGDVFESLIFLASDSTTVVSPPTQLKKGDIYYIVFPLGPGKTIGVYSDVLLIGGSWKGTPLPGWIRRIGEQRVSKDDTGINNHIKVTASPTGFVDDTYPATKTVVLTLNIDHTGTGVNYDPLDVKAKYLITTEADYAAALAANPLNRWKNMNVPPGNGQNRTTTVSFADESIGTHYIHWYVESGVVYAHSQTVTVPPLPCGGFGPYIISNPLVAGTLAGNPHVCSGNIPMEIKGESSNGGSGSYTYLWQKSVDNGVSWEDISNSNTVNYIPGPITARTRYRRVTTDSKYGLTVETDYFEINVVTSGLNLYWNKDATDNNWNNPANWVDVNGGSLNMVPLPCTNVHITSGTACYPSLKDGHTTGTDILGLPVCENITFAYGSELAYQHLLTYEKAFVQYNFGYYANNFNGALTSSDTRNSPTILGRDRWHVLAAPLKKMASGDFALAGYPFAWQAKHEVVSTAIGLEAAKAGAFNKNDVNLCDTYNTISVNMAGYNAAKTGYKDQKNLEGLKGIVEIPYFENSAVDSYYPGHSYDKYSGKSTFYYYNTNTLQPIYSPVGTMKRGEEAYRFIYEGNNRDVPVISEKGNVKGYKLAVTAPTGSGNKVLVGNPFLTSINSKEFYDVNSDEIEAGSGYLVYKVSEQTWEQMSYVEDNSINSFQAFIVTLKNNNATLYFLLEEPPANTRAVQAGNMSLSVRSMTVQAADTEGNGEKAMLTSGSYSDMTRSVTKVISLSEHAVPEVFFVDNENSQYNLIQLYDDGVSQLGIGVKASETGKQLTLNFENVSDFVFDNNVRELVLVDKLTGNSQDLTRNSTYSFVHKGNQIDGQYVDMDRFVLKFGNATGINTTAGDINIYYLDKAIRVEGMDVDYVDVFGLTGNKLYKLSKSGINYVSLNQGVYIVRVYATDGTQKTARIMVK